MQKSGGTSGLFERQTACDALSRPAASLFFLFPPSHFFFLFSSSSGLPAFREFGKVRRGWGVVGRGES